jgi:signal transduction histidine kinase
MESCKLPHPETREDPCRDQGQNTEGDATTRHSLKVQPCSALGMDRALERAMSRMSASAHRAIPSPEPVRLAASAVSRRRRTEQARELAGHGHSVQFFEDDRYLVETVVDFFAAGMVDGQRAVAFVTREHGEAITAGLHEKGFDVDRTRTNGQLILLDAEELLASCMAGSTPDAARFRRAMDGVLGSHTRFGDGARERRPVLAFTELVDVLCRQGNIEGAIRMEELWNELSESYTFALLCAYSLNTFSEDTHDGALRAICNQHAHVLPTERYMRADDGARLREIALLQQRALALETELERRRALEAELRDALRAAQAASRAKSDFLTVMSHELRTPLNAIGGYAQLLEMGVRGPVTPEQREDLERIERSQRHLLGLINDVLNFAKLEAGRVQFVIDRVPMHDILLGVEALVLPQLRAKGLRYADAGDWGDIAVHADEEKTRQVLINLLSNAIKFTPAGGEVRLQCAVDDEWVHTTVSDSGVGIPADRLDAIFEPFVQVDRGLTSRQEGTGLGLAISRDLARHMGGDLTATSTAGVGSSFTLTLPRG